MTQLVSERPSRRLNLGQSVLATDFVWNLDLFLVLGWKEVIDRSTVPDRGTSDPRRVRGERDYATG